MTLPLVALALSLGGANPPAVAPPPPPKAAASPPAAPPAPAEKVPPAPPNAFELGLAAHDRGDWADAARYFFWYVRTSPQTALNYGWAQYFLGKDLVALGFTQAGIDYLVTVAKDRPTPAVLAPALSALEAVTERVPFDHDLVVNELLYGTDFGIVPAEVADFVEYYRGLVDYQQGRERWGDRHFDRLKPDGAYARRALQVKTIYRLERKGLDDGVVAAFAGLAKDPGVPKEIKNDAKLNLARLYYERKEYPKALGAYDAVDLPPLDPGRGEIYLERAWVLHRMGQDDRAFGFLTALDAPSFRNLFLPEKYLLRSLIYNRRCHFLSAKRSARQFQRRFRAALQLIKDRGDLVQDPRILEAAKEDHAEAEAEAYLARVREEKGDIDRYASLFATPGLTARLREIYQLSEDEALRRKVLALDHALTGAADAILRAEENLRLQDYEVALDMFRRNRAGEAGRTRVVTEKLARTDTVFPFEREYWNDELRNYRLFLKNRCPEVEGEE
ncbi:MAG: tetratricopeptide repeat protein [Myxococcales bacterium]